MPHSKLVAATTCAIGLDIGGTKIAGGVVSRDGRVLKRTSIPTPPDVDESGTLGLLRQVIQGLRQEFPAVRSIGIGAAGMVDWPNGHIRWAPNNNYRDLSLKTILAEETGLPTVVDNDANVAAWAETRLGAGVGHRHLAALTVGTGIGAGLVFNGQLYRGSTGIGGEVGHIMVDPRGKSCGCGSTGCLEAMASGKALGHAGRAAAQQDRLGTLARLAGGPDKVTGETVFRAACQGDPTARSLFDEIGYWLGVGLASIVTLLDIELIVVGGGLSATGELLLAPTRSSLERHVFARARRKIPPVTSALFGGEAGTVGAAILALDHTEGVSGQETAPKEISIQEHETPRV